MEIPVYLFTGFLESGKTTFIQEALEGPDFNMGERTLFLLCEEGETEYHPSKFFGTNVFFETVEDEEDLSEELLVSLQKKHRVERVIVEYNGMWGLDSFYRAMPAEWLTYQEMMFADARTFLSYNQNMRQLVFDKLKSAELVVFNRCDRKKMDEVDEEGVSTKMRFHKIVRVANRKSQILYEYGENDVEMDTIQDPLPFDTEQPVITIRDDWYAEWYRDINEDQQKYDGKILHDYVNDREVYSRVVNDSPGTKISIKYDGDTLNYYSNGHEISAPVPKYDWGHGVKLVDLGLHQWNGQLSNFTYVVPADGLIVVINCATDCDYSLWISGCRAYHKCGLTMADTGSFTVAKGDIISLDAYHGDTQEDAEWNSRQMYITFVPLRKTGR